MIKIPRWQAITIIGVIVVAFLYVLPNFMSAAQRESLHASLPSWLPVKSVNLGLDLRGGAHLLYEVDVQSAMKDRADLMLSELRRTLREDKIGYSAISGLPQGVRVTLRNSADGDAVRKALRGLDPNLDFSGAGNMVEAVYNPVALRQLRDQTLSQSIEIVRRRIDALGTTEPIIARQGDDRIVIQAPGADATQLKAVVGTTAKLAFHLVPDPGTEGGLTRSLPYQEDPGRRIAIERRAIITGDMLDNAQPAFQDGAPVISFKLNSTGARRFCEISKDNVGRPFAIVLDNEILSAPVIREAICGGQGQISGGFTVETASNLALLLRAGALPAPMKVVEERTVGPTLGSDSIEAGKNACIAAILFVTVFSILSYGLFGVFATIGLFVNVMMIIAVLSMLQATLTLPGIAGIVLTIGLAVDGNVLVFERIKEELRAGRSVLSAIDTGYSRARTTITDSNLTALIAALILFSFGTGPIKGFAVTMCIGVATSYFCALMLTRLIVLTWYGWAKPKTIAV